MGAGVGDETILHKVLYGVSAAQAVVSRAMADVPKGPTRRKTASPFPVSLVEKALLHGWVTAHRDQSMPACNCPASAGLKQPFRRVVQLCYEAMGHKNDDPDRAIKGFMKWRKEERNVRQI